MKPKVPGSLSGWLLLGILLLGLLLRLSRWPFRWNQITLAYATYFSGYYRLWEAGEWWGCLTQFVGAHPPLYSALFSAVQTVDPRPATWMGVSLALSCLSIPLLYRLARTFLGVPASLLASLLLALSVHHSFYSLEINDYPLLVMVGIGCHRAFVRTFLEGTGKNPWGWILWAVALLYTHFLGVTLLMAQGIHLLLASRPRLGRFLLPAAGVIALGLPLAATVWKNAQGEGYINAPTPLLQVPALILPDLWSRFGPSWIHGLLLVLALPGFFACTWDRRGTGQYLLVFLGVSSAFLLFLLSRGVAATGQFPYYLHLLPAWLLLLAAGAEGMWRWTPLRGRNITLTLVAVGVAAVSLGRVGFFLSEHDKAEGRIHTASQTHPSVAALVSSWRPGEAAFLLAPPGFADDDKDRIDPAYAHLSPGWQYRFTSPPGLSSFEPVDPYWGNPFDVNGHTLYTFTQVEKDRWIPLLDAHLHHRQPVWVCSYDLPMAPLYRADIETILAGYRVEGPREWTSGLLYRVMGKRDFADPEREPPGTIGP